MQASQIESGAGTGGAVLSAVTGMAARVRDSYLRGGRMIVLAPAILLLAVVPEAVQHVAEIQLGMFGSIDAFREHGRDAVRMVPGIAKVIGFVLAILATTRFWNEGSIRRALIMSGSDWLRVAAVLIVSVMVSLPFSLVPAASPWVIPATLLSFLLQVGFVVWTIAAVLGDRSVTLRTAFTRDWPSGVVMTLLAAAAFAPCQALHMLDHRLAIGAPVPLVWLLMAWDALFVGLFAALVGSALWVGYRRGATWRGWRS